MLIDFGYGVDLSEAVFKEDAERYALENYAKGELKEQYSLFCECNSELVEDGTAAKVFCDEYIDTYSYGFWGLLARWINECEQVDSFFCEDSCLYVGARIPENQEEKEKLLTREDISRILAKYLNPILEKEISVQLLEIYDS